MYHTSSPRMESALDTVYVWLMFIRSVLGWKEILKFYEKFRKIHC